MSLLFIWNEKISETKQVYAFRWILIESLSVSARAIIYNRYSSVEVCVIFCTYWSRCKESPCRRWACIPPQRPINWSQVTHYT